MYSESWRHKLKGNKNLVFPKELCPKMAEIVEDFSFACMKEAFVATLLVIARREDCDDDDDDDDKGCEFGGLKNMQTDAL